MLAISRLGELPNDSTLDIQWWHQTQDPSLGYVRLFTLQENVDLPFPGEGLQQKMTQVAPW